MYPILCYYNSRERLVLPFIFPVRKFFDNEVQEPMGSLARPVTTDRAHDDAGTHEHGHDHQCSVHDSMVPLMLPNTSAMTTAEMNMPVSM